MMIDERRLREDGEAFVFVDVNDTLQKNLAISRQLSKFGNILPTYRDLVQRQRVPALPLPTFESWQDYFIIISTKTKDRQAKKRTPGCSIKQNFYQTAPSHLAHLNPLPPHNLSHNSQ
jgi:hypothetical protein